ncbi:hypothetical protein BD770DRAFT_470715 [Pilaira anomala]|nr:hypothetical protein BD770DRAFT_470715 [Pilaira anomala]
MSEISYQSSIDDWKASSHQHVSKKESIHISTITHTDYVTSTLTASTTATVATTHTYPTATTTNYAEDLWEHRIHRFLPVILAFAIIGILTVFVCLVYLAYRFYQANRSSRKRHQQQHQRRRRDAEEALKFEDENKTGSTTLSNIIPWLAIPSPLHASSYTNHRPKQREPIRYEKSDLNRIMMEDNDTRSSRRPSFAWLIKILPNKTARPRHVSLPILTGPTIDNLNVPISSTFKPIDTSFLTLVPRSEIWLDPNRRRGVDELDIWERKKSGTVVGEEQQQGTVSVAQPAAPLMWRFPSETAYPTSPESFERRFPDVTLNTEQEYLHPHQSMSESSSQSVGNNAQEKTTLPIGSISYLNGLQHQIKEDDEITINLAESSDQNDVNLVRQALEASRLKNSSSQWLHTSGSKSF